MELLQITSPSPKFPYPLTEKLLSDTDMAKKSAPPAKKKVVKPIKKTIPKPFRKAPAKALKSKVKPVAKAKAKPTGKPVPKKLAPKKSPVKTLKSKPVAKATTKTKPAVKSVKAVVPKKPIVAKVSAKKASKTSAKKITPSFSSNERVLAQQFIRKPLSNKNLKLTPFLIKQRQRLLELKDTLLDAMRGVARDNLHAGTETSAFGMHQADAGSDAYDRDFALSMLSKEQGSLYEIDEALKRIEDGTYGVCETCEKPIRHDRLEALPFTRYTVECQAELEKRQHHHSARPQITSLFGLTEEETESEEEETTEAS
jgi:RNA polymerase-binding transcription factor DksA